MHEGGALEKIIPALAFGSDGGRKHAGVLMQIGAASNRLQLSVVLKFISRWKGVKIATEFCRKTKS